MTTSTNSVTEPLDLASRRLVRTVDALTDDDWSSPSLLPGWTRAHVVSHLALNAEGLAGAVIGVLEGRPVTMYPSDERRDSDIEDLASTDPAELRDRLFAATTVLHDALTALATSPSLADTLIERTPGSARRFHAGQVGAMRLREVEIHHVDVGAGYSPAEWPDDFARALLLGGVERQDVDMTVAATDLDRSWRLGPGVVAGPTVTGPAAGLAWWLTGRTPYPGVEVTSDGGALPRIEGL